MPPYVEKMEMEKKTKTNLVSTPETQNYFWRRKRRYRRRQHWVRRKLKLPSIRLKQFQPKTIKFCKIKGIKCLFQGSSLRLGNNYWQYPTSFTPEGRPGGGGWGILALSLASFYEDYQHLQNIFTASNTGLPLVRLLGFNLSFYQHESVDYVVEVDNCWPMLDTPLKHPNSQPARMLMGKKKIIIPSIQTKPLKKERKSQSRTTSTIHKQMVLSKRHMQHKINYDNSHCLLINRLLFTIQSKIQQLHKLVLKHKHI